MQNATVTIGDKKVRRYNIIGTKSWHYRAYEPSAYTGPHSGLFRFEDQVYGDIATRRPTDDLQALPQMSDERFEKIQAFQKANFDEAYSLILQAFPETEWGRATLGEIILSTD